MTSKKTTIRVLSSALLTLAVLVLLTPTSSVKQITSSKGFREHTGPAAILPGGIPAADQVIENYGKLPLVFEKNQGQVAAPVKYLARGSGYNLYLTPNAAVSTLARGQIQVASSKGRIAPDHPGTINSRLRPDKAAALSQVTTLRMNLVGGNPQAEVVGIAEQSVRANYFIGSDSRKWQADVPTYARTLYHEVYRGVDLVYHGQQRQLEYDFIVKPGADPNQIRLSFDGIRKLRIDDSGELVLTTKGGELSDAPATALGLLQKNHVVGQVSWDVTADVSAGANFGWLLRKRDEHRDGQVRYYSREGAALVHNGSLAPRLVLVYRR